MNKKMLLSESIKALKNSFIYSISLSVVFPIVLWVWKPEFKVPLWLCISVLTFLLLSISFLGTAVLIIHDKYKQEREKKVNFPRVVNAKFEKSGDKLFLTQSLMFGYNSYVSIFLLGENDSELFMGIGVVINIQISGLIQVQIKTWDDEYKKEFRGISQNNKTLLSRVIVKPYVGIEKLEKMHGGIEI